MYYKDYSDFNAEAYGNFNDYARLGDYKNAQGINYDKYKNHWDQMQDQNKSMEELLRQYGADAKKSNKIENEAILLADILRRIGISEDQLHNLEPGEIKALIRNYDINRILNEDTK